MRLKGPKRTYRIRRKRRDDGSDRRAADDPAIEVVGEFGCCLVEAVLSASVLIALVVVPAHLLLS